MGQGRNMSDSPSHPYDAVLVVSFGGPEGPDDVSPSWKTSRGDVISLATDC